MIKNNEHSRFVSSLRKKLLDLSKRNNLINYTFGASRVRPNLRIIDEVPDLVYIKIQEQKDKLIFFNAVPNPEPLKFPDELSADFIKTFRKNKDNSKEFQEFKKKNSSKPNKKELERIENTIKDETRIQLGLAPVTRTVPMDEVAECSKRGINPSYYLNLSDSSEFKHNDKNLQSLMFEKDLDLQLSRIYARAKLSESELGINTLFLCFGFLEWYDSENSSESLISPILTMPVQMLTEMSENGRFYGLKGLEEDPSLNLSLKEKLKSEFNIELPSFSQFLDTVMPDGKIVDTHFPIEKYLNHVISLISGQKDWSVLPQLNLSILSFQKIALYQDLENYQYNDPVELVSSLMSNKSSLQEFPEEYNLEDPELQKKLPILVSDADSSQVSAIIDASEGQNMIIEGPPGTGKSQTITNMIANLMAQNKKILFVAEKRTALQVVKNRLDKIGLGSFCLELHSNKIRRSEVIDSLKLSLKERDSIENSTKIFQNIEKREQEIRKKINEYLKLVSQPTSLDEETLVRDLIGQFLKLKNDNKEALKEANQLVKPLLFSKKTRKELYALDASIKNLKTLLDSLSLKKFIDHPLYKISNQNGANLTETKSQAHDLIISLEKIESIIVEIKEFKITKDFALTESKDIFNKFSNLPSFSDINPNLLIKYSNNLKLLESQISEVLKIQSKYDQIKSSFPNLSYTDISSEVLDQDLTFLISKLNDLNFDKSIYDLISLSDNYLQAIQVFNSADMDLKNLLSDLLNYNDEISTSDLKIILFSLNQIKDLGLNHISIRSHELFDEFFPLQFEKILSKKDEFINQKEELVPLVENFDFPSLDELKEINAYLANSNILKRFLPEYFSTKNKIVNSLKVKKISFKDLKSVTHKILKYRDLEKELLDLNFVTDVSESSINKIKFTKELLDIVSEINSNLNNKQLSKKIREKILSISSSEVGTVKFFIKEHFVNLTTKFLIYTNEGLVKDQIKFLQNFIEQSLEIKNLIDNKNISKSSSIYSFKKNKEELSFIRLLEVQTHQILNDFNINEQNLVGNPLSEAKNILYTLRNIESLNFSGFFKSMIFNKDFIENRSSMIKNKAMELHLLMDNVLNRSVNFLGNFSTSSPISINLAILNEFITYEKDIAILIKINNEIKEIENEPIDSQLFCEFLLKTEPNKNLTKFLWIYSNILIYLRNYNHEEIFGDFLNNLRSEYKDLDSEKLIINSKIVKEFLNKKQLPKSINKSNKVSQKSGVDLINHLISKPLSRVSVRDLIQKSGNELLTLMPCFMMSPLSVAQFLPQEQLFDVLIIDEASQIKLEDILSSVSRSKQIIVVGDNKQLPPTNFFQSDDSEDEDSDDFNYESILDMTEKAFDKKRRLKWHYRSQHEDLIKFSNVYFYDNDLILFPSTHSKKNDLGVVPVKVNGVFQNRKNKDEAVAIVDHAIEFIKNNPDLSLALVAINKEQTTLIEDLFYEKSKGDVVIEEYLQKWEKRQEDFIIKNLENIQGDERDAIFISMVYGEDASGNFYNRFGPINSEKGHRRLNVLFSRAKRLMKVFYSIPEEKILINEEKSSKGVKCLKNFIRFLNSGEILGRTYSSPNSWTPEISIFEEAVKDQLEKEGYVVKSQIGESGYFIDLVIENPTTGEYILGIECDGATYHSSKFMRDRDKTRQMILERLGWKIHRIWSTDWFNNSDNEIKKINILLKKK